MRISKIGGVRLYCILWNNIRFFTTPPRRDLYNKYQVERASEGTDLFQRRDTPPRPSDRRFLTHFLQKNMSRGLRRHKMKRSATNRTSRHPPALQPEHLECRLPTNPGHMIPRPKPESRSPNPSPGSWVGGPALEIPPILFFVFHVLGKI